MTDTMMIDVSGLAGTELRESDGAAALLKKDGIYKLLIRGVKVSVKKETGNTVFAFTFVVQDEDEFGKVLYNAFPVTGEIPSGPRKGEKNIRRLGEILLSTGREASYLGQLAAQKQFDAQKIADGMTQDGHNICYAFVQANENEFNGNVKIQSEPRWFVSAAKHADARQTGVKFRDDHRWTHANQPAPANTQSNGATRTVVANDKLIAGV